MTRSKSNLSDLGPTQMDPIGSELTLAPLKAQVYYTYSIYY